MTEIYQLLATGKRAFLHGKFQRFSKRVFKSETRCRSYQDEFLAELETMDDLARPDVSSLEFVVVAWELDETE